ncbi:MAG: hypothetical protein MUC59_15365 [Saprospiraceae bacterium]|nr:hypothetical protein [Saprospiraceae bacterium]
MPESPRHAFIPAFYARIAVESLTPLEMDLALEAGYYRSGREICTNLVRVFQGKWVSAVMLRLPITTYSIKKRHRKLLKTNQLRFRHEFKPFNFTTEKAELWQRFKSVVHGWGTIIPLDEHLLKDAAATDFNMWELNIFEDEKLVAFSVFDHGATALASLEAAYDPNYASHSLGFYTMLLEINYCQAQSMNFYYPGFFPKDVAMFKYKLRPGEMQFLCFRPKAWLPFSAVHDGDWYLEEITDRMSELKLQLGQKGYTALEGFSSSQFAPKGQPDIRESNIYLLVADGQAENRRVLLIDWNLEALAYRVFEAEKLLPNLPISPKIIHRFYEVEAAAYHGQFESAAEIVHLLKKIGIQKQVLTQVF